MNSYEELQDRTASDSLTLLQLVGVPRSMSTVLGRVLNENNRPSVYVSEPFNRDTSDPEEAARLILNAYHETVPYDAVKPVIITKNMASYMSPEAFSMMENIASFTIWNIRHPYVQLGSLLTRIVNDLKVGAGEDEIDQRDIFPYLDEACDFLENSSKSQNYSKTGWQAIDEHSKQSPLSIRFAVDGYEVIEDTIDCINAICEQVGFEYTPTMISNWKKGFINIVNRNNVEETSRSAWTSKVAQSTGILAVQRASLDILTLPKGLKEHIQTTALPVYNRLKLHTLSTTGS